jgi:hypothetical protein
MQDVKINGREFAVEFEWAKQGHRLTAMEWDGDEWQTLPNYNGVLCLGQTHFESLCNLSSDLFDEAVHGETFALALRVPMITSDESDCAKCGNIFHYEDMKIGHNLEDSTLEALGLDNWDYVCLECLEAVKVGA